MMFVDYTFHLMSNDDVVMDEELRAEQLHVKEGDRFEVVITPEGRIVFKKLEPRSN